MKMKNKSYQDCVGLALESDRSGSLLDGLHGVLHLVQATVRRPGGHVAVVLIPELKKLKTNLVGSNILHQIQQIISCSRLGNCIL